MNYLRLKKQSDFQKLFGRGKRAFSPSLTLVYFPAKELKMGVSVGKRHGKSVQRNRIKRLVREAFRLSREEIKGTYHIVILPKVRDHYAFQEMKTDLLSMIQKAKL